MTNLALLTDTLRIGMGTNGYRYILGKTNQGHWVIVRDGTTIAVMLRGWEPKYKRFRYSRDRLIDDYIDVSCAMLQAEEGASYTEEWEECSENEWEAMLILVTSEAFNPRLLPT